MRNRGNRIELGKIRIYLLERLEIVLLSCSLKLAEYWVFVSEFG